jgi:group I intron endonuclease
MKGVYVIRHLSSGRTYVGSTVDTHRRWRQHKASFLRGDHPAEYLMRTFRKYGADAFEFLLLEETENLVERENHWIKVLNPEFNVAPVAGSVLGIKRSDETKKKMSLAFRGKPKDGSSRVGKKLSESHRASLARAKIGCTLSPEHKAQIALSMRSKRQRKYAHYAPY